MVDPWTTCGRPVVASHHRKFQERLVALDVRVPHLIRSLNRKAPATAEELTRGTTAQTKERAAGLGQPLQPEPAAPGRNAPVDVASRLPRDPPPDMACRHHSHIVIAGNLTASP